MDDASIGEKHRVLLGMLNGARTRLWGAAEARSLGRGGITEVARATGLSWRFQSELDPLPVTLCDATFHPCLLGVARAA